jgi:hypothetical protein
MHNKKTIARSYNYKNGVKLIDICNPVEKHCKSWVISVPHGKFTQSYGVYADNQNDALIALCRYDQEKKQSGSTPILKTSADLNPFELRQLYISKSFILIENMCFSVKNIQIERADFYDVSSRYESILDGKNINERLLSIKEKFAKIILKQNDSNKSSENLSRVISLYRELGGHVIGEKSISMKLNKETNKFDILSITNDLKTEFSNSGLRDDSYDFSFNNHEIVIQTDPNEHHRILFLCNKIKEIDPLDRIINLHEIKNDFSYIPDVGKTPEKAKNYLSLYANPHRIEEYAGFKL